MASSAGLLWCVSLTVTVVVVGEAILRQCVGRNTNFYPTYWRKGRWKSFAGTMQLLDDLKQLAHPYYLVNLVMSLSFLASRFLPGLCEIVFQADQCGELSMVSLFIFFYDLLTLELMRSGCLFCGELAV